MKTEAEVRAEVEAEYADRRIHSFLITVLLQSEDRQLTISTHITGPLPRNPDELMECVYGMVGNSTAAQQEDLSGMGICPTGIVDFGPASEEERQKLIEDVVQNTIKHHNGMCDCPTHDGVPLH